MRAIRYSVAALIVVLCIAIIGSFSFLSDDASSQSQYRVMLLTGGGMWASTTDGAATNEQVELGTNDVDIYVLDFDPSTDESAQCTVALPPSYRNNSPVYATFYWTTVDTGTGETVSWDIQAQSYSDSDPLDASWGSVITVNDAVLTENDCHISAESAAVTIGNTPSRGDLVQFKVTRDVSDDNLTSDARLLMVKIRFAGD